MVVAEARAEALRNTLHELILFARGNDFVLDKIHAAIKADEDAERNELRRREGLPPIERGRRDGER